MIIYLFLCCNKDFFAVVLCSLVRFISFDFQFQKYMVDEENTDNFV